ncbi:helix-turn-helix domain-containing protein [Plebeiibacterium marinum]|uniref:Helix-turn-helix transcriptional regulator n=1 Tax=Plebeiibacterium marinum TaxID=2992111 RepID=A0AAE3MFK8_9BACT|nr:response regulator transcription factor [Plebeiobacterium marinum]MCW3806786.1 helix-turn-helix transcriptional regulator [Plebeiobacterium marinum]
MKAIAYKVLNSISELHTLLNLKKPSHPLISVVNADDVDMTTVKITEPVVFNFYVVNLKKNCQGKIRYGQQYYDFDEGVMTFVSPSQRLEIEESSADVPIEKPDGWMLVFHPDLIQGFPLAKKIKEYGFFSYAVNEALHLSDKEDILITGIIENIKDEIELNIDHFTQDVIVSHLDLLLNYSNRFYNRQFITRKKASSDLLVQFEELLNEHFLNTENSELPTVQYFAKKLFVSSHYLNDMLKSLTGQTTQQHIQNHIIEKAKELLSTTNLSISEIAYQLGFEYSQSFNKLFKKKTNTTPMEFRQSFN